MPTLKEIKGRIGSVRSTLKITSAMKLVSSAKLRKAQAAIENMLPYQSQLQRLLALLPPAPSTFWAEIMDESAQKSVPSTNSGENVDAMTNTDRQSSTVIVAVASNSSLCGGFNANVIARVKTLLKEHPGATVYSIGRKMADAMRKAGYPSPEDFSALSEHPAYAPAAELATRLMKDFFEGRTDRVLLVYNHYVSSAKQVPVVETFLPAGEMPGQAGHDGGGPAGHDAQAGHDGNGPTGHDGGATPVLPDPDREADCILEPSAKEILKRLLPKTVKLKLYTVLLDSAAAEHAARTIAMQTATDNGEDLLDELTLQYNKGRQQKITSEILDLAGGQNQE